MCEKTANYLWDIVRDSWLRENITEEMLRKIFSFDTPEEADRYVMNLMCGDVRIVH
jgi:hypothetical protein